MLRIFVHKHDLVDVEGDWRGGSVRIVDCSYNYIGKGKYEDSVHKFKVYSKRTGKLSRDITAVPIEIEGVSPCYWVFFTTGKIRSSELVYDAETGVEVKLEHIAMVKYMGNPIYAIVY